MQTRGRSKLYTKRLLSFISIQKEALYVYTHFKMEYRRVEKSRRKGTKTPTDVFAANHRWYGTKPFISGLFINHQTLVEELKIHGGTISLPFLQILASFFFHGQPQITKPTYISIINNELHGANIRLKFEAQSVTLYATWYVID